MLPMGRALPRTEPGARRSAMSKQVVPMLAAIVDEPFDRKGWLFEIKWDGWRAITEIDKDGVRILSRNQKLLNHNFPPAVESLRTLDVKSAVLDGEIVVIDRNGKPDFQQLQNYTRTKKGDLVYYLFDILYLDGYDLTAVPLARRKSVLKRLLTESGVLRFSDHIEDEGIAFFREVSKSGLEGMMAKDGKSPYEPGLRTGKWVKVKTERRQEAVIGGFTEPRKGRTGLGALVLGVYERGNLVYVGHVGTGFAQRDLTELAVRLKPLVVARPPFRPAPQADARGPFARRPATPMHWVKPKFVCEVRFFEWTSDGLMRQPVYLGLRFDKNPKDVVREKARAAGD